MPLPQHIAIIMDGNGRWAQARRKPRTYGHIKGTRIAKKIITSCSRKGIRHLTLYAFSSENWLRPQGEVSLLMKILRRYLLRETKNLVKENICFQTVGDLARLPADVVKAIDFAKEKTAKNTGLKLTFAISYGSRWEIAEATKALAQQVADGTLDPQDIDESLLNSQMQTYPSPDPDLIIRTSGERRLSNFLMWQAAYSEFYFSETLWPDFTENDLDLAIANYLKRERRFGSVTVDQNSTH
jgi:undecaprenyl diphosphate synthase